MVKKRIRSRVDNNNQVILTGIIINCLIIFSLIILIDFSDDNSIDSVQAYEEMREEVNPGDYPGLSYGTASSALQEINSQLTNMQSGNISTIDGTDSDNYTARCFIDYEIGSVIYWEITDANVQAHLDANTGEIIEYVKFAYQSGSKTKSEIETLAASIATQFSALPQDRSNIYSELLDTLSVNSTDVENGTMNNVGYPYWLARYNRTKDSIISEDCIYLIFDPNGYLCMYYKNWNMDLIIFNTAYTISEFLAETTATDYVGDGCTVRFTDKRIIRPNHVWTEEELSFGLDPVLAYVIGIEDEDGNLLEIHVHGRQANTIVGGDYSEQFYS